MSVKSEIQQAIDACDKAAMEAGLGVSEGGAFKGLVLGRSLSALLELVEALLAEDDDCVVSIRTARALTRVTED